MRAVSTRPIRSNATIAVPGSKSYTHRLLIAAALASGNSRIARPLQSQDTLLTRAALAQMGVPIQRGKNAFTVQGTGGHLDAPTEPIFLGNSGTSMRLLLALALLIDGRATFTGTERMCQRPVGPLIDSLSRLGMAIRADHDNGCPPVTVSGSDCTGGRVAIDCSVSSQYLSGLLLAAPCLPEGLVIDVTRGPVSRPYIDMTVDILETCGIRVRRDGYRQFTVPGGQVYRAGDYTVEPDASQAGYFWAAAAVTGARIKVAGVTAASRQGDVGLAEVFAQMGCTVQHEADGIAVAGGSLAAVDVDMGHMPDMVPTLAVVAAFAKGTTVMRNVAHLRAKESDRLTAVCNELTRMGISAVQGQNELRVTGGSAHGADIDTYDDHRMAMSFAVAGLKIDGVRIGDPGCVAKSFPDFWQVWETLYR